MQRISLHTLGCKLNFAETSTIAREFERRDFVVVPFGEPADVTVINTCTVTGQAEQKCRNVVRKAVASNPDSRVVVTGCYAQLRPDEIAAIDGVDLVVGNSEKPRLFELTATLDPAAGTQVAVSCIDSLDEFGPAYSATERTRAFLKIQDGCDYACSFCTIPAARGPSRSAPIAETVAQAHEIAERGYKEIVLSGVNVGLFGHQHGVSLLDLLKELIHVDGIERFRISSIEPNLLTDEIIDFVGQSSQFMPHFHIPLQSGDNVVLGLMRRRYRRDVYSARVDRILNQMPDACIGVDVIVGSPGESIESFETTAAYLTELPAAYFHVFTYSERPGTIAGESAGLRVDKQERRRRSKVLRALSSRKRSLFHRRFLGETRPVLWEGGARGQSMHGFTDNYVKVRADYDSSRIGVIDVVSLSRQEEDGVIGTDDGMILVEHLIQ